MKYMIHACPAREWYVNDFLVPSMIEQGISESDIYVYMDRSKDGNLMSFVRSLDIAHRVDPAESVWHLQDDVLICRKFAELTASIDFSGVVCGFGNHTYDTYPLPGEVSPRLIWWSMQCMRIPNWIARRFVDWFYDEARYRATYAESVRSGKDDDVLFRDFLINEMPKRKVLNYSPSLVDHIDYLIGGSKINPQRGVHVTPARYWEDQDLVEEFKFKLLEYVKKGSLR